MLVDSLSLIYRGDFSEPVLEGFERIFMHLFSDTLEYKSEDKPRLNDYDAEIDEFEDELLIHMKNPLIYAP